MELVRDLIIALAIIALVVMFVRMLIRDQRGENDKRRAARKILDED